MAFEWACFCPHPALPVWNGCTPGCQWGCRGCPDLDLKTKGPETGHTLPVKWYRTWNVQTCYSYKMKVKEIAELVRQWRPKPNLLPPCTEMYLYKLLFVYTKSLTLGSNLSFCSFYYIMKTELPGLNSMCLVGCYCISLKKKYFSFLVFKIYKPHFLFL